MKPSKLLAASLLFAASALACRAAPNDADAAAYGVHKTTIPIEVELEPKDVRATLLRAATARRWTIVERQDGRIVINLAHRGYDATLTLVYDDDSIDIYSDSWRVNKKGERKKREDPEGWIINLAKDIPIYLQRAALY